MSQAKVHDTRPGPIPIICRYRVKPGMEKQFGALLAKHWPTLHKAGLASDQPARTFRCQDQKGNAAFVEMFSWRDGRAIGTAHQSPQVMELWEPMGAACTDMEFWEAEELSPAGAVRAGA